MPGEIEFVVKADGVETPWWSPEIAVYMCELCGKKGTEACQRKVDGSRLTFSICVNANPYCG
jgi:hypothetical protein